LHQTRSNPRMQSDPMLNRYNNQPQYQGGPVYAVGDGRSKDTLHTGGSSGASELYRDSPQTGEGSRTASSQNFAYSPQDGHYGNTQQQQYQDESAYSQRAPFPPRHASQATPTTSTPQLLNNSGYSNTPLTPAGNGGYHQSSQQQHQIPRPPPNDGRPQVPTKAPINLNDSGAQSQNQEQRTSWLKKRFSRAK